jgi:hypothetical protein
MIKKECAVVDLKLEIYVGKCRFNVIMKCFDGWNKTGITSQIGKMFGLNQGYLDFYMKENLSTYRSIGYYDDITEVKAVYRKNEMTMASNCETIDNLCRLGLKRVLIRKMDKYVATTYDENLSLKQLDYLIKYTHGADYLTVGYEIMLENENIMVSSLKDNCEIVCHYRIRGGGPKRIGTSSSYDDDDEEQEEPDLNENEEEEFEENISEFLEDYNLDDEEFILDPKDWTGWMRYKDDYLSSWYENEESSNWYHEDILERAMETVKEKISK